MSWEGVGQWLKKNAGGLLGLAGAVATGNLPGGIAAVASMVTEATGETDPVKALAKLQADPETLVRLEEIAKQNEQDIRKHHKEMLELELTDQQKQHSEQQQTIRTGDTAEDETIRLTRPTMAKQSWTATIAYCIGSFGVHAITGAVVFDVVIASILSAPAWAYMGFRTSDKWAQAWKAKK